MKNLEITTPQIVEELLVVLDDDILNVELSLLRLSELRSALIRRKDDELESLIETVKLQAEDYKQIEARRKAVCSELAVICGCQTEEVNLTLLRDTVGEDYQDIIEEKQNRITELVNKLAAEYAATAILLQEFARINSMLLNSIFKPKNKSTVYNHQGKSRCDMDAGLISCRF